MNKLIDTLIDKENIGFAKILYSLRRDLDIYCLITANADNINERCIGKSFFTYLQQLALQSITLNICKMFEKNEKKKKRYTLNSIEEIIYQLGDDGLIALDDTKLKNFIQKYHEPSSYENPITAIQSIVDEFRERFKCELKRFRSFRDKKVAHSEYNIAIVSIPSYDVMESFFSFGTDFYNLISAAFLGVVPCDFRTNRKVKVSLKRLLRALGFETIKTDVE